MKSARMIAIALPFLAIGLSASSVQAGGFAPAYAGRMALACDNGSHYPLLIRAVSEAGEVVTGYVGIGRHHVHVRLIPMGDGYRYAGQNLWFDGKDDVAILYFGKSHAVNCTVIREAGGAAVISAKY